MKKLIALLLAVIMVLPLAGCGGSKDKEKLVGTWQKHSPFSVIPTNSVVGTQYSESKRKYDFYSDNSFRYEFHGYVGSSIRPENQWNTTIRHGKYTIKDGMITLHYDDGREDEEIPYHINEYTKELIFDVETDGTSDWSKTSSTPKQYDD